MVQNAIRLMPAKWCPLKSDVHRGLLCTLTNMASKLSGTTGIQLNLKTGDAHHDLGLANDAPAVPSLAGIPLKYIS
jgi:hypothetical protein